MLSLLLHSLFHNIYEQSKRMNFEAMGLGIWLSFKVKVLYRLYNN